MNKDILVRLEIPLYPEISSKRASLKFNRWLPIKPEDSILIEEEKADVRLWFDMSCSSSLSEQTEEDLPKWENPSVKKIFADVILKGIPEQLINEIKKDSDTHDKSSQNEKFILEYSQLGDLVINSTLKPLNRLISYFRNEKGQYWLEEYMYNPDDAGTSNFPIIAKAKIFKDDSSWFLWNPPLGHKMILYVDNEKWLLKQEEWQKVIYYVHSSKKPNLVLELLANADKLYAYGYFRSVIIESIAALEVAVNEFTQAPYLTKLILDQEQNRIDISNLKKYVKHLGLTGTIRYFIPLLFDSSVLPTELLNICNQGIELRQNVVHNGQRSVNKDNLKQLLSSIRKTCEILIQYTES